LLVAGKAAAVECGPVRRIADDGAISPGDFGKVVPVAALAIERDEPVDEVEIEVAVVV